MKRSLIVAAMTSALIGCAPMDGAGTMADGMAMADDMTPEMAVPYARMAAASDLFEIQSSQMALSRSQNQSVRQFAQMLITHHTQTTQQLMAAAQAAGLPPMTPTLMPMQQRMITELQQASASGFDRAYLTQQVPAHEMALALHSNYARDGDTAGLRTTASAAVPIIQQHLTEAQRLNGMMR